MSGARPDPKTQIERRHLRAARFRGLIGKKVLVSTCGFRHVSGTLRAFDDDGTLRLRVADRDVTLREADVARIHEADPAQSDYIK